MKFRFIKQVDSPVKAYQGHTVSTGDVIELTGDFIEKAKANPNYEAVNNKTLKLAKNRGQNQS